MSDNRDLQQRIQRIGTLVSEIESIADPSLRASTRKLVQLLMEFHGAGLDRALEIVARTGGSGMELIHELGRDPLVSSLLLLYGLHPDDLPTRVTRAVAQVQTRVQRNGGQVELLGIENGVVRLHMSLTGHTCASTAASLHATVEDAIYEAAPDVTSIIVEGLAGKPAGGFISLDTLLESRPPVSVISGPTLGRASSSARGNTGLEPSRAV